MQEKPPMSSRDLPKRSPRKPAVVAATGRQYWARTVSTAPRTAVAPNTLVE